MKWNFQDVLARTGTYWQVLARTGTYWHRDQGDLGKNEDFRTQGKSADGNGEKSNEQALNNSF